MHSGVVLAIAAILVVGVVAQWIGWRLRVPSIVFLLGAGLVAGPLTGLLDPDELFGDLLFPFISLAVAVILFEGAFGLSTSGVRAAGRTVWMLLTVGALVTMGLTAVAAHELLNAPWSLAWVLSGVLVVTGPTVIGPLVRSIGLRGRVASILEAEGTLIDPLGAIVTVLLFQAFYDSSGSAPILVELFITLVLGAAVGGAAAWLLTLALARFVLPDELHNVTTLTVVVVAFAVADSLRPEAGLVAVTALGLVLGSQKRVEVHHVLEFNETLRTLFISGLFILLGARIAPSTLSALEWRNVAFLGALVVIVRPISVALSTLRSGLSRSERVFIAGTAPRGIVAAAVASIFSLRLTELQVGGSQLLVSATFTVIVGTVMLSGFGARTFARRLDLIDESERAVVILGTNPVATRLAEVLEQRSVNVSMVSLDRKSVASARMSGHLALHGSVLDEELWNQVAETAATAFIALTGNDEVNVLACRRVASLLGRRNVFRVAPSRREHAKLDQTSGTTGRLVFDELPLAELSERLENGWRLRCTPLTDTYTPGDYRAKHGDAVLVGAIRKREIDFAAAGQDLPLRPGDVVVAMVQDDDESDTPEPTENPQE